MGGDPRFQAYLERIGLAEAPPASSEGLERLLIAHRQAIAFENLDILLGRSIVIDSDSVYDKLVTRRRGGYCFEQNRLFSDMLAVAGLPNRPLLARTWLQTPAGYTPPRTHVLLLVQAGEESWIADAGFGGSYVPPLPLIGQAEVRTADGATHRLRPIANDPFGDWLLERAGPVGATDGRAAAHDDWQAQYSFDMAVVAQEDLEQSSHWTSTRPGIRHTTLHVVSRVLPGGFAAMSDRRLRIYRSGRLEERLIVGPRDYAAVLRDMFGLSIPEREIAGMRLFAGDRVEP